jgi:molybdate transport system regulatory protein
MLVGGLYLVPVFVKARADGGKVGVDAGQAVCKTPVFEWSVFGHGGGVWRKPRRVASDQRKGRATVTPVAARVAGFGLLANRAGRGDCRAMEPVPDSPRLRIRIVFGDGEMIGPGKAELLERIARCGSIAAAGREMGMSYKRAWQLIGTLNAMFRAPLVESTRGGPGGGGAVLSELGQEVLTLYRAFEDDAAQGGAARLAAMQALLRDIPEGK